MTTSEIPFVPFPKIPRLRREIVITEKIDGTNAQVHVSEDGIVRAGSRNRWITPEARHRYRDDMQVKAVVWSNVFGNVEVTFKEAGRIKW